MIFNSTPPAYSSANDSIVYTVYDAHSIDPTHYPDYKYVAELWIAGVLALTCRRYQQPNTNMGIFDFGPEIREYINASIAPLSTGVLAKEMGAGVFSNDVVIKIREEYNGTIGAVVLTDSSRIYFNHYNGRISGFTILGNYLSKPLSDRPLIIDIGRSNAYHFIPYFSNVTTSFNVVVVCGSTTRTKTINPTAINTAQLLNICPAAINAEWAGTIPTTATYYTVAFGGVTYTCNIIADPLNKNYPVHFLNKYGSFETHNFSKVSQTQLNITRKLWQQLPYTVDSGGVVALKNGNVMNTQAGNYAVTFEEQIKLNTDMLTDKEFEWLYQLIVSPIIYIEDSGILYPVTIDEENYNFKNHDIDGLSNLTVSFKFGQTYKTQFN